MTSAEQAPVVQVFVRDGCHLCDDLLASLEAFRLGQAERPFVVQICDIEERADWLEHYTAHVPVVVVNDEEVCHYFFDQDELERALKCL